MANWPLQQTLEDIDPDIAWLDREIQRCEDGPRRVEFDNPDMNLIRNERLMRLRALRSKLLGEEH